MLGNPYQSPGLYNEPFDAERILQRRARFCFRFATFVLLIPAVYNYWAFDAQAIASGRLPSDFATFYRTVNVVAFVTGATVIWFLGLPVLQAIAGVLRMVFANDTNGATWQRVLYRSLNRAAVLAIPGAALWAIWVFAFYRMGVNFYKLSWAIGVPAHLLAACWYIPLIHRWYRVAESQSSH